MCGCIAEINEKLKPLNGRLQVAITLPRDGSRSVAVPYLPVEKIDRKSRVKPPGAIPSFCPFCGEPYTAAPAPAKSQIDAGPAFALDIYGVARPSGEEAA